MTTPSIHIVTTADARASFLRIIHNVCSSDLSTAFSARCFPKPRLPDVPLSPLQESGHKLNNLYIHLTFPYISNSRLTRFLAVRRALTISSKCLLVITTASWTETPSSSHSTYAILCSAVSSLEARQKMTQVYFVI